MQLSSLPSNQPGISGDVPGESVTGTGVWAQFMGHPRVAHVLRGASQRPTGTYMFAGSPGVGKRNAARVFAASLICPRGCGECNTCRRVMSGIHPDITILQPEGYTFPVEVLRATAHAAAQSPIEAAHRVFIIQEADRIPERSQNALLKALEEPNPSVIWILLTHAVQPFLPTIVSRCQVINFPPIAEEAMLGLLQSRLDLHHDEAQRLVRIARGDLNAAVRLAADPLVSQVRTKALKLATSPGIAVIDALSAADEVKAIASAAREQVELEQSVELARLEELSGKEGQAAWRKKLTDRNKRTLRRVETETFIDVLSWMGAVFRDLAVLSSKAPVDTLIAQDQIDLLMRAAPARPTGFWVDMIEHCLDGQLALRNNANAPLVMESVLLRLV